MPIRREGSIVAVAVGLLLTCTVAVAGSVRFTRETITIRVMPDRIHVEGAYTFDNTGSSEVPQRVFYPFPIDSLHAEVDGVAVRMGDTAIEFKRLPHGVGFSVPLPPSGSATVVVSYEQSALDSSGCYILTSTSSWDEPLEDARFAVHLPDTLVLAAASYEFDRVTVQNGERVYEFAQTDFMPEADLCFRWRRADR